MAWIAPVVGAAASLIGGAMNSNSQASTNATNERIAANEMAWQTNMSNTAEQRHVADLRAAGLNPALAYGTPAPVPGAAPLPQVSNPSPGQGVMAAGQTVAQAGAIAAQTNAANSQAAANQANARNLNAQASVTEATAKYAGSTAQAQLANSQAQLAVIKDTAFELESRFDLNVQNTAGLMQNQAFREQLFGLQKQLLQYEVQQSQLGISKAQADSDFFNTPWGRRIAPFLSNTPGVALGAGAGALKTVGEGVGALF